MATDGPSRIGDRLLDTDELEASGLHVIENDVLTVPEVARYLRIGRSEAYAMAARGELPVLRIGRRVVVPRRALLGWIDERVERAAA